MNKLSLDMISEEEFKATSQTRVTKVLLFHLVPASKQSTKLYDI